MHTTPVHIEKNRINRNYNVLLFLLPALVFAMVLSLYVLRRNAIETGRVTQNPATTVLGEESELDK